MKTLTVKPGNLYRYLCAHSDDVKKEVESYLIYGYKGNGPGHCAACVALRIFKLTDKRWNSPSGSEFFSAALAYIVNFKLFPNVT